MKPTEFLYPARPSNVPASVTEPSVAFRKEVGRVMGSIVLFFIVYLLMFVLSIGLIVACFYAGIAIVTNVRHFFGILAGIGLIGLGVMVFIFLIKFLFAVTRYDHSGSIEITENDQPELFAFIREIAKETQTAFPKKIYLSPDVNASVFYDSSFWSMFLPIRKNLMIGFGLVNSLSVSEFKAVIAHEFGHFSQRSMKLGSFVYNVNKIIHNMLFENNSYSGFLSSWASVSGVFAIFASITAHIAQGIQWILGKMYGVINKSYMRLSREMEFHADAVAASVSGSRSLITALRRVELANTGYSIALQKCDELFRDKKISANIYLNQRSVLKHLANEFKLAEDHGLPVVSDEFLESNNISRLNVKDQWASHPTTADREKHLSELAIDAEIVAQPAWVLFRDSEQWQLNLTGKVYESVPGKEQATTVNNETFESRFFGDINDFSLPVLYNGFYDDRQIVPPAENEELYSAANLDFDHLFSSATVSLSKKIKSGEEDLQVLKAIAEKKIQAKTFDFDGVKYQDSEAGSIAENLEKEIDQWKEELKLADKNAIAFFLNKAGEQGQDKAAELRDKYNNYFRFRRQAEQYLAGINAMLESLGPIFGGQTIAIERINVMIGNLKSTHEPKFKKQLRDWINAGVFESDPAGKELALKFFQADYGYFSGTEFFDYELSELNQLCNESWRAVNILLFKEFKSMLEWQEKLLKH